MKISIDILKISRNWKNSVLFLNILALSIFLPHHYILFPELGIIASGFLEAPIHSISHYLFPLAPDYSHFIYSDSHGFWVYATLVVLAAIMLGTLFSKIKTWNSIIAFKDVVSLASYSLGFFLLKYGIDKISLHQFPTPEANLLFTPTGKLSRDMLYWATIGSSPMYSIVTGCLEIILGVMLLFKRTRLLGAFISCLVTFHILLINLCFNITVVGFTTYLLLLSFIIIAPNTQRLLEAFHLGKNSTTTTFQREPKSNKNKHLFYTRCLILSFILLEITATISTNYSLKKTIKPEGFKIEQPVNEPILGVKNLKRLFIHSTGYLILDNGTENMVDLKITPAATSNSFHFGKLSEQGFNTVEITRMDSNKALILFIGKDTLNMIASEIELGKLPLLKD